MKDINEIYQEYKSSPWSAIVGLIKRIESLEAEIKTKADKRKKKVS